MLQIDTAAGPSRVDDPSHASQLHVVTFSPDDPENPKNWSRNRKILSVVMICVLAFFGVLGSSFYATIQSQMHRKFGVSPDVNTLGLTLYVLGFALGPLLWGPMSEMYGHKITYGIAWPLFVVTLAPSAWVENAAVIIVFRFFSGTAAAAPLSNGAAVISDLYGGVNADALSIASTYLVFCAFSSSVCAPIAGFFLTDRYPNQPWSLRVQFFAAVLICPLALCLPETHAPTILARRAKKLRKAGNPNAWAPQELAHESTGKLMRRNIARPAKMLVKEPIAIGAALWTAISYGILYFAFESYPVIFLQQHDIPERFGGLPFIGILVGMLLALIPYPYLVGFFQRLKLPEWMGDASDPEAPESRLKLALFACICLPISTFWLAWTSGSETHWIVPALSGLPFGFANLTIFFTFITYLTHTYELYTASSMAVNTFVRSLCGAIFPLIAHDILDGLGTKWGVSVFAFISFSLMPIPIIFLRNGKRLRASSPFAQEALAVLNKLQSQKELEKTGATTSDEENMSHGECNDSARTVTNVNIEGGDVSQRSHTDLEKGTLA